MNKGTINILWLDDMREPQNYLFKKKSNSGAFVRNKAFYDKLLAKYNPKFTWVKNFDEFTNYIIKNGMPDLVSFDHDLGKGLQKGADCATWLVNYCQQKGIKLPKCFVHSANPNGQQIINSILNKNTFSINEQDIINMVKRVINELHKGQQLMIPFDGDSNTEPYNYMQFMEYLESLSTPGKLAPPQYNFEEIINSRNPFLEQIGLRTLQNYECVFDEWKVNNFLNDVEQSDDTLLVYRSCDYEEDFEPMFREDYLEAIGKSDIESWEDEDLYNLFNNPRELSQILVNMGKEELRELYNRCCILNDLGQIRIERVIDLPGIFRNNDGSKTNINISHESNLNIDDNNNIVAVDPLQKDTEDYTQSAQRRYPSIGVCWTYEKGCGEAYCSDISHGTSVNLIGWVNPEEVDWELTVQLESLEEYELRLNSGALVQLDAIQIIEGEHRGKFFPLKQSVLVRA